MRYEEKGSLEGKKIRQRKGFHSDKPAWRLFFSKRTKLGCAEKVTTLQAQALRGDHTNGLSDRARPPARFSGRKGIFARDESEAGESGGRDSL